MALRIGGGAPPPMAPAAPDMPMPEEMMSEEMPMEEPLPPLEGGMLDPLIAGYRPPTMGPFMCGNCEHFMLEETGTCRIVAGPIEEEGVCNLFTAPAEEPPMEMPEEPMAEEIPPMGEMPAEPVEAPPVA